MPLNLSPLPLLLWLPARSQRAGPPGSGPGGGRGGTARRTADRDADRLPEAEAPTPAARQLRAPQRRLRDARRCPAASLPRRDDSGYQPRVSLHSGGDDPADPATVAARGQGSGVRGQEIGRIGRELYETQIRSLVESEANIGRLVSIDIHPGDYEVGDRLLETVERLQSQRPDAEVWTERIGFNTGERRRREWR